VDEDGYARTDKFDGLAESADQLIIHGIDGAFGWLLLIDKNSNEASMSFATADTTLAGLGTCSNKNKGEGQPLDPPIDRMDRSGGVTPTIIDLLIDLRSHRALPARPCLAPSDSP